MASITPRLFTRSVRQLSIHHPRAVIVQARRYASNKHPKDFVPPTQADLDELRESVREFTSELPRQQMLHLVPSPHPPLFVVERRLIGCL